MHGGNQSGEFLFLDVLQFVQKKRKRRSPTFCGLPDGFEQGLQILFEIAVIG